MRHRSVVLISVPEPGDDPELVVRIQCDQCGTQEWRTHITHLGTLARVLNDVFAQQPDDGQSREIDRTRGATEADRTRIVQETEALFNVWRRSRNH